MTEWRPTYLRELMTIKNGKDHKALHDGDYPVYGSGGIMRYVDEYLYDKESVLLPRKGTLNNIQYANTPFWTVDTCYYTEVNTEKVLPYFLYNCLRQYDIEALNTGSAIPSMTFEKYYSIQINLPNLETQRRIADVLSRYDALIENYQRQIKLLEEAAQRLYKEWFVDLRFPGHQSTPIINNLPQAWQKKKLGEIIAYEIGGGWGFDDNSNKGTVPAYVIRGTDMEGLQNGSFSGLPFRYHLESNFKSRKLEPCDIIFEVSGGSKTEGVAKTFLIQDSLLNQFNAPVICASFCKLIRLKCPETAYYVYDTLKYWRASGVTTQYDKRSASSIVNYRWKDFLEQQEIMIPNDNVLSQYLDSSKQIHSRMSNLAIQIRNLSEARDRLLPKLMSAEIEVSPKYDRYEVD